MTISASEARRTLEGLEKRARARRVVRNFNSKRELDAWIKAQGPGAKVKVTGPYASGPKYAASRLA